MATNTRTIAEQLADAYITALQAKNKEKLMSIIADDFVLEVPFNVAGTNDLSDNWVGPNAAAANFDVAFASIEVLKYADIEITGSKDGTVAFLEGRGVMKMANGRPYRNRYIFRFDVAGGKITRIREYTSPVTGAIAFGIPLPQGPTDFNRAFVTAGASQ